MHDYKRREQHYIEAAELSRIPNNWQQLFIKDPATESRVPYVSRLMSATVEGVPRDESEEKLELPLEHSEDPAIVYQQRWQLGIL